MRLSRSRLAFPAPAASGGSWTVAWAGALVFAAAMDATLPRAAVPDRILMSIPRLWQLSAADRLSLALLCALPIIVCRRWPVLVLAALLAELLAGSVAGLRPMALQAAIAVLVFVVCARRPRPIGLLAAAAAFSAWAGQDWLLEGHFLAGGKSGNVVLTLAVATLAGIFVRERREHTHALRERSAAQAVTAERLRIARELHDMVAHSIGIVAIQAGAAKRVIDTQPARARDALDAIETTSRETLAGLRHMLGALRQAECEPEDRTPSPGLADLDRLTADAANAGVQVEVHWRGEQRHLPPEIELSAFRIIQESLTNVVRHAGAQRCRVGVEFGANEVTLEIIDDGRAPAGAHPADECGGYGLTGMRERVSLLRGQFTAGPRPEGGFRVEARIPA